MTVTLAERVAALDPRRAREILDAAAAQDLFTFLRRAHPIVTPESAFVSAAHLRAIAWHVQQVVEGKIRRLLIAVPPRHFKSYVASVAAPAWALGRNPGLKVICASYGSDLAKRFAEQSRSVMVSHEYRRIFPALQLVSKSPPVERLATTGGGYRFATSVGGVVTGIGADLLIIDDPMKASEAQSLIERENAYSWFKESMMTRFDKPGESGVIVVMQRLHQDDLIGRLLQEEGWTYLKLPGEAQERISVPISATGRFTLEPGELLFPERFNATALAQLRSDLGEAAYNAQILQAPAPPDGAMIKLKWFRRYETPPARSQLEMVVQVWDTALADSQTADYSACTTWGVAGKNLYLLHVLRKRLPYYELEKLVPVHREQHGAHFVFAEKANTGISLLQNLRQLHGFDWFITIPAEASKVERLAQQSPKLERGRVLLPTAAPWLEAFESEVAEFPYGRHDDQVDAMAYFLRLFDYGRSPAFRDLSMFSGWVPGTPVL